MTLKTCASPLRSWPAAFFCLLAAALWLPLAALAGEFSASPVRIYMKPRDRAVPITITNEGEQELVMQAEVYLWKQKPGGEDDLSLNEDLIVSPPIFKLAPKARQVVRLAQLVRQTTSADERTYRLVVREVPEARAGAGKMQLQVALAFSMPIFITPPGASHALECDAQLVAPDTLRATCENKGTAYAQPREFSFSAPGGEKLATSERGGYILPGIRRSFDIKREQGPFPRGSGKLEVTLDDRRTRSFDITIAQ